MRIKLPFEKQDYKLLRTSAITLVVCISIAATLYFTANQINNSATSALETSRAQYEQASASVQLIAEEEATIIRYIDRYKGFVENGYVADEDRLAFIENISSIRDAHSLFPISIDIGEQNKYSLSYDPLDLNPGEPVDLNYSNIQFSYPLLHEEDLTRLVTSILDLGSLFLPTSCRMTHNNLLEMDFTVFMEQMYAECEVYWYTFNLNPLEPINEEY